LPGKSPNKGGRRKNILEENTIDFEGNARRAQKGVSDDQERDDKEAFLELLGGITHSATQRKRG